MITVQGSCAHASFVGIAASNKGRTQSVRIGYDRWVMKRFSLILLAVAVAQAQQTSTVPSSPDAKAKEQRTSSRPKRAEPTTITDQTELNSYQAALKAADLSKECEAL